MTSPFPTSFPGQTLLDPGLGGSLASALAGVLAAQQQKKEQEWRVQELAQRQAQGQALADYYAGQVRLGDRQEDRLTGQAEAERRARAQVGGAQRRALGPVPLGGGHQPAPSPAGSVPLGGGYQPSPSPMGPVPLGGVGNATQAGPGLVSQAFGAASAPSRTTDPATMGVFEELLRGGAAALDPNMAAVFQGVDDLNMAEAVKGVQEVQALQPKEPEIPTSSREYGYYKRLQSHDPAAAAEYRRLFLDPKPTTQISNVVGQSETAFSKQYGEDKAKLLTAAVEKAKGTAQMHPMLDEAYRLVGKSFTGFGANQLLNLARVAGVTGWKPSKDKVADTQTLLKLTREQTLNYLRSRDLGSGTAVSDGDRLFMERQSGADITLDAATIKRVLRINIGSGVMSMQESINDLRDQSISFPANAAQLEREAAALERRLHPIRARYAEMLRAEDASEQDIRSRAGQVPGIRLPGQP